MDKLITITDPAEGELSLRKDSADGVLYLQWSAGCGRLYGIKINSKELREHLSLILQQLKKDAKKSSKSA